MLTKFSLRMLSAGFMLQRFTLISCRSCALFHTSFVHHKNYPLPTSKINVSIVGSGPAAFYTAQYLLSKNQDVHVDMFEKLPVPFGLVRFGVAPDHPDVKNVISTFTKTAKNERFQFFGNVNVGQDVTVKELLAAYNVVILAYGAEEERHLGIPGERLKNVFSAREFVSWYNGIPDFVHLSPNLAVKTAVVIGQGNVALDVARILLTPIEILQTTDITQHALEALKKSNIETVWLVGRRGPLQVAFTTKELREMTKLPNCRSLVNQEDFQEISDKIKSLPRPRKRLTELMMQIASQQAATGDKAWGLKFLRSPLEIIGDQDENVKGIKFRINKLQGDGEDASVIPTDDTEMLDCGLVVKSIGYKGVQIDPDVPFDKRMGVIPNDGGKVQGVPGLYCSGWVQRGPVGVILHTMNSSFETAQRILDDIQKQQLENKEGTSSIRKILSKRDIKVVDFIAWNKIDEWEQAEGKKLGKPREKIIDVKKMLEVAKVL